MTGRIKALDLRNASGFIRADNGLGFHFDSSAVMAYDQPILAIDQLVTFDADSMNPRKAVNVCVHRKEGAGLPLSASHSQEKRPDSSRLRYSGFTQKAGVRAYCFNWISAAGDFRTYIVNTDLALLTRHRVGIQEGPALCMRILAAELAAAASRQLPVERSLTEKHVLAYVAAKPVPAPRPHPRRTPRPAAASAAQREAARPPAIQGSRLTRGAHGGA